MDTEIINIEVKELIKMPDTLLTQEKISFELINTLPGIAAGIRAIIKSSLIPVKALSCKLTDIQTSDGFNISYEIRDVRIRLIPVLQSIPIDFTTYLDVKNDTNQIMNVYSGHIAGLGGKYADNNAPICTLRPHTYMHIPNITVEEGTGYYNSPGFSLVGANSFECLDFPKIIYMDKFGYHFTRRISADDLVRLSGDENNRNWFGKKILVIDPEYDEKYKSYNPENFDIIVPGPVELQKGFNCNPSHYHLSFNTYGTLPAMDILSRTFRFLVDEYTRINSGITTNDMKVTTRHVDNVYNIIIRSTHKLFAEILMQYIVRSGFTCSYLSPTYSKTEVTFRIDHPESQKIVTDAVSTLIQTFTRIMSGLVK